MRKKGLCIIFIFTVLLVAIIFPWENIDRFRNRLLGGADELSSLKVYSLGGDMEVYVDDEDRGLVRKNDTAFEILPLSIGEHTITLTRISDPEGSYIDFEKVLPFENGIETVISWELGPTQASSSGWVLYAKKSNSSRRGEVQTNFTCIPEDCSISIDEQKTNEGKDRHLDLSLGKQHIIKAEHENYQSLEFNIFPDDQQGRLKLEGYEIFIEIVLYQYPL